MACNICLQHLYFVCMGAAISVCINRRWGLCSATRLATLQQAMANNHARVQMAPLDELSGHQELESIKRMKERLGHWWGNLKSDKSKHWLRHTTQLAVCEISVALFQTPCYVTRWREIRQAAVAFAHRPCLVSQGQISIQWVIGGSKSSRSTGSSEWWSGRVGGIFTTSHREENPGVEWCTHSILGARWTILPIPGLLLVVSHGCNVGFHLSDA